MTAEREAVLDQVKALRQAAEQTGLVEPDPWAKLDEVWKGPDAQIERIAILGEDTMAAVRTAYAAGRVEEAVLLKILDLARTLLPLALAGLR